MINSHPCSHRRSCAKVAGGTCSSYLMYRRCNTANRFFSASSRPIGRRLFGTIPVHRPRPGITRTETEGMTPSTPAAHSFGEEDELPGHIIDSLILPKVLDEILTGGGSYVIKDIKVGQRQNDPSHARIEVRAASAEQLRDLLDRIHDHGA